jgi:hypothetical protein
MGRSGMHAQKPAGGLSGSSAIISLGVRSSITMTVDEFFLHCRKTRHPILQFHSAWNQEFGSSPGSQFGQFAVALVVRIAKYNH